MDDRRDGEGQRRVEPAFERRRWLWDAWRAGDRAAALEAVPDTLIDELLVHGRPEECREKVEAYRAEGVTTPVLMLIDTEDPAAALRDLALH